MILIVILSTLTLANAQSCTTDTSCHFLSAPCTNTNCICDPNTLTCKIALGNSCIPSIGSTDPCETGTVCSGGRCLALHDEDCTEGLCVYRGVCIYGKCRAMPGYAWDPIAQAYKLCDQNCATCFAPNNPSACLSCTDSNKEAIGGVCACLQGASNSAGLCFPCDSTCGTCAIPNNPFGCTSCAQDIMTLISGVCFCPIGMAWNRGTRNCEYCDPSCKTCSIPGNPNYCTSCNTGTLVNGNCITEVPPVECPYGTAPDANGNCLPCHYSCETCLVPEHSGRCTSCSRSKRLVGGMCVPYKVKYKKYKRPPSCCPSLMASINNVCKCVRGYIGNSLSPSTSDTYCLPCHPSCLTCYEANNPEACTSCFRGLYLVNGKCTTDPLPLSLPPINCSPVCITCTAPNDPYQCTNCSMTDAIQRNGKCYCPPGTYNNTNVCVEACDFPCSECFIDDSSICTACPEGLLALGGTCVCPNRTALSPIMPLNSGGLFASGPRCVACDMSCETCAEPSNPLACTSCNDPRATLTNGECLCPDSAMSYDVRGLCACPPGQIEENGVCLGVPCPPGTFLEDGECVPCEVPNCAVCSTSTTCAECESGFYLQDGLCLECPPYCLSCVAPGYCTVCAPGYVLNNGQCVKPCPACCSSCTFDELDNPVCTSCINNYVYVNGQCATCSEGIPNCANCRNCVCTRCNAGYYLLSPTQCAYCANAIPNCVICNGPDVCLQCRDGFYFNETLRQCLVQPPPTPEPPVPSKCPEGTYKNKLGKCCECHYTCKACIGPGIHMCTKCYPDSILYPVLGTNWGKCICRSGHWFDRKRRCCISTTVSRPPPNY